MVVFKKRQGRPLRYRRMTAVETIEAHPSAAPIGPTRLHVGSRDELFQKGEATTKILDDDSALSLRV